MWLLSEYDIYKCMSILPLVLYSKNLYTHFESGIKWEIKFTGVSDKYKYTHTLNTSPWELHPPLLSHSSTSATVLLTAKYLQQEYITFINRLSGNYIWEFRNTIQSYIPLSLNASSPSLFKCCIKKNTELYNTYVKFSSLISFGFVIEPSSDLSL